VIGLLTAVECVRAGAGVDLIDADDIPSRRATSYDTQRVVRTLHRDDPPLTMAAARAQRSWLDAERRLGASFYHRSGSMMVMPPEAAEDCRELLAAADMPSLTLSPAELSARYPRIRFPAGLGAIVEPEAGTVLADRALTAMAGWLRAQPGVRLHPFRRAEGLDAGAVRLAGNSVLTGDRVIAAAGPWSRDLLPAELGGGLTLYRQSMLTYAPVPSRQDWAGLPVIPRIGTAEGAWLIPPVGGTQVRLSSATSARAVPEMTDRVTPRYWRDHLVGQFAALLTDFDPAAVSGAADGYYLADSASGGPLLTTFHDDAVLAYAACGGASFKLAPVVAETLAAHAVGRPPRPTGLDAIDRPRKAAATRGPGQPRPMEVTS
jgi:sarcosine oxidase